VNLRFNESPAAKYIACTPWALALERTLECQLLAKQQFVAPVLDVGCGDGLFASILFADEIDTGIDLDPSEIQCARKTGAYQELICCPGSQIPKESGTYQTAFSNSVLEHIPDLSPVLREVHRLLKPGGNFFFTVPTDEFEQSAAVYRVLRGVGLVGLAGRFGKRYNRFWRHFHAYNTAEWKRLAIDAGFEVVQMVRYNPPSMTTRNDVLAPMAALSSILKRSTDRWVLSPKLRGALLRPFAANLERSLAEKGVRPDGSLLFVQARRVLESN